MKNFEKILNNKGGRRYPLSVRNYTLKLIDFLVKESKIQTLKKQEVRDERNEEIKEICIRFMDKAVELMKSTKGIEPKEAVRNLFKALTTVKANRKDKEIKIVNKAGKEWINNKANLGRTSKYDEVFGETSWLEKFKTRWA